MLEREVEIYRRLAPQLGGTGFLTYGDASELDYSGTLDGIQVLCNRWGLPKRLFPRLVPLIFARTLSKFDVFKTNQANGSEVAITAKRIFGKKLIARCGYMWSANLLDQSGGEETDGWRMARRTEHRLFNLADRSIVTTEWMRRYVVEQYGVAESKVSVIPNYVMTDVFKPFPGRTVNKKRLCFVRLDEVKDPMLLLDAVKGLDVELDMIGGGALLHAVQKRVDKLGIAARFIGTIPNDHLPEYFNSAAAIVCTSRYEGQRKVLLEAMACGVPVIGVDVRGVGDVIQHDVTGYVCERTPEGVRQAIQAVLGDDSLRERLGQNARQFAVEQLDIKRIVELELGVLGSLFR